MSDNNLDKIPLPSCGYYLNTIYFYLTKGCNLRCRHCWIEPEYQGKNRLTSSYISKELFQTIIREAKPLGLSGVKLTGGEPLLHPDILNILQIVADEKLSLNIETNGVLCTEEVVEMVKNIPSSFISVSLDSPEEEIHEWVRGVKGSFKGAVNGIKNILNAGVSTQIIMTVMEKNADQIESMVYFAKELGVKSIKFNLVNPTARGEDMHKRGETLQIDRMIDIGHWIDAELAPATEMDLQYSYPFAFRSLSSIFSDSINGRCGIKNIIGVLGNGKYALCGIGETVEELIFGNAGSDSLEDIWNHNPMLNGIRTGLPVKLEGICGNCIHKEICLASCVASNYYHHRNLFAPFWFCDQAHNLGLFPKSRMIKQGCK